MSSRTPLRSLSVPATSEDLSSVARTVSIFAELAPFTAPRLAEMVTVPGATPLTRPVLSTVATAVLEEDHVTPAGEAFVDPSAYTAVAENCCWLPIRTVMEPGDTEILLRGAVGVTVLSPPPQPAIVKSPSSRKKTTEDRCCIFP